MIEETLVTISVRVVCDDCERRVVIPIKSTNTNDIEAAIEESEWMIKGDQHLCRWCKERHQARPGIKVEQTIGTVEPGSTVIGLRIDSLG